MDERVPELQERNDRIAALLLANRGAPVDWGEMSRLNGEECSAKIANRFLLCCLLDYQMPTNLAWANGYRLIDKIHNNPEDIWSAITSISEIDWKAKHAEYRLHRFPAGHNRLWRIGARIRDEYGGDARRIWEGKDALSALVTLWDLGVGEQLSRMVVGALRDCGQIEDKSSDIKGDIHVCRVLGRAVIGDVVDPENAVRLARRLHPANPWQLDAALWQIGKDYCKTSPKCSECYLSSACAYAQAKQADMAKFEDATTEIVLKVGTEGGSVTLLRHKDLAGPWVFRLVTDESTFDDLLSEEDLAEIGSLTNTNNAASFEQAIELLDKYQWVSMLPMQLDPDFWDAVLTEVHKRGGPSEVERWRTTLKSALRSC